jgi:hypothetical protein
VGGRKVSLLSKQYATIKKTLNVFDNLNRHNKNVGYRRRQSVDFNIES